MRDGTFNFKSNDRLWSLPILLPEESTVIRNKIDESDFVFQDHS